MAKRHAEFAKPACMQQQAVQPNVRFAWKEQSHHETVQVHVTDVKLVNIRAKEQLYAAFALLAVSLLPMRQPPAHNARKAAIPSIRLQRVPNVTSDGSQARRHQQHAICATLARH